MPTASDLSPLTAGWVFTKQARSHDMFGLTCHLWKSFKFPLKNGLHPKITTWMKLFLFLTWPFQRVHVTLFGFEAQNQTPWRRRDSRLAPPPPRRREGSSPCPRSSRCGASASPRGRAGRLVGRVLRNASVGDSWI